MEFLVHERMIKLVFVLCSFISSSYANLEMVVMSLNATTNLFSFSKQSLLIVIRAISPSHPIEFLNQILQFFQHFQAIEEFTILQFLLMKDF